MTILDTFCGAGGASAGYVLAGFTVIGVDNKFQPNYPYRFYQGDAIEVITKHGHKFDAIHASPPCQLYSRSTSQFRQMGYEYIDLIDKTRGVLKSSSKPFIIENVVGAPLINPVMLCGEMFGIKTYRHRLFESNFYIEQPEHPLHPQPQVRLGRKCEEGDYIGVVGHINSHQYAKKVMEIGWMSLKELTQSIPPCYTKYIGMNLHLHFEKGFRKKKGEGVEECPPKV